MKKKLFLSLLCGGLVLGLTTGCGTSTGDSKKYDINVNASENIDVKTYVDHDKDYLIVYLTNNNDYNIGSIDVDAKFYDANGNKVVDDNHVHNAGEDHHLCLPFDQLLGGGPNGDGRNPVYGLASFPGVTVHYPASYTPEN